MSPRPSPRCDRPVRQRIAAALCAALALSAASGCTGPAPDPTPRTTVGPDRNALADLPDPFGEDVSAIAYLDQGWPPEVSQRAYFLPQGSRLVPYAWFLHLEAADGRGRFRDDRTLARLRFLPQVPDAANPDGLPVGFVREPAGPAAGATGSSDAASDAPPSASGAPSAAAEAPSGDDWLGLTCAACHTAQLDYEGVGYRIDGGPAMADIDTFLHELTAALRATRDDPARLGRLAIAVRPAGGSSSVVGADGSEASSMSSDDVADPDAPPTADELDALRTRLDAVIAVREGYDARNGPPGGGSSGYGRVDAFGAILNEVLHHALPPDQRADPLANAAPADAPVSYPPLWDTPYHDRVQWVGSALNDPQRAGNLGRNVGEVLGVFGWFEIPADLPPTGYPSSVAIANLQQLEADWATLWSPTWPEAFPTLDAERVAAGEAIYAERCAACHALIDRTDPNRHIQAVLADVGTDPRTAANIWGRRGQSGVLIGRPIALPPSPDKPERFGEEAPGGQVLGHVVAGIVGPALAAQARAAGVVPPTPDPAHAMAPTQPGTRYKARPLNGVWATAPYLHNGSVPTLYHLLLPPEERPARFRVGSRRFDPVHVGFAHEDADFPEFVAVDEAGQPVPGNGNGGHVFGTDLDEAGRWALIEYLKSL